MKYRILFVILLIGIISSATASTIPYEIPMVISGQAYVNNGFADKGTEVIAKVNDVEVDKVIVEDEGRFGFALQNLNTGDKINFYVDGIYADGVNETLYYDGSKFERITLRVEKHNYYLMTGILLFLFLIVLGLKGIINKKRRKLFNNKILLIL